MAQRAQVNLTPVTIQLKIEYNRKAISVLKDIIPMEFRSYDVDTNTWTINRSKEKEVREILEQFYPIVNYGSIRDWKEMKNDSS